MGSITFKPMETIGKLTTFAIKKLSPEEVAKAYISNIPLVNCQSRIDENRGIERNIIISLTSLFRIIPRIVCNQLPSVGKACKLTR